MTVGAVPNTHSSNAELGVDVRARHHRVGELVQHRVGHEDQQDRRPVEHEALDGSGVARALPSGANVRRAPEDLRYPRCPMWIKICGITNEEDALLAVALGADALGFVFAPGSPRQVTPHDRR